MVTMVEIDMYLHRNRGIEQLLRETEKRGREEKKAEEMEMETGVVNTWLEHRCIGKTVIEKRRGFELESGDFTAPRASRYRYKIKTWG
ncbi:hypothetical protein Q7C36_004051 [Tachysurus vachellii]|uniref:Uncharacterized protein n=1 Tax=Tachysurus vachellii TaxID=175792 RepID=A0AA88T5I6_TACVA|nr:hypothetical protein Q7C36_004051 [Tachysurus vachellii]